MSSINASGRNPKLACAGILALVFICGALAGAVAMNLGAHKTLHKDPFWTAPGKAVALENLKHELSLTPVQTEQIESILDDFAKYYRTVLSDGKSRMMQTLNDEQKRKFEKLIQEKHP